MTTLRRSQPETVTVHGYWGMSDTLWWITAEVSWDSEHPRRDAQIDRLLLHTQHGYRELKHLIDSRREVIYDAVWSTYQSYGTDQHQQADHASS